jgi:hypothetical protein
VGYLSAGGLENVFQLVTVYNDSNENFWIKIYQLPGAGKGVPVSVRMCFDVLSGTILAQSNDEGAYQFHTFLHEWQAIYKESRADYVEFYTTFLLLVA